MAKAYDATVWVRTDLRVSNGYDKEAVERLMYKFNINETSDYDDFLNVQVGLASGQTFEEVEAWVDAAFAGLVEAQKAAPSSRPGV